MDAIVAARIEISRRGEMLHALMTGRVCPTSIRLAFLDIASCCLEHNIGRLLLEDRSSFRGSAQLKPQDVFELSLCFSEWFRGRQVAYVCRETDFDLGLGVMTCKANGLNIECFGSYDQGLSWLLHAHSQPPLSELGPELLVDRQLVS
ncbi:hypothetical protein DV711_09325 [Motiliproteus coralliicola]|uniref:Uncharacterized protein n=1 Tax=Motiliproteus coralliicola TaxID=2283196 RepID=A0A369WM65_9GAMM|nr:hypothetical protein [Motiliproteus coralliicola]RDE22767.1 hypothetical protein DV711_09325 [Motiliproteus coralliicola]